MPTPARMPVDIALLVYHLARTGEIIHPAGIKPSRTPRNAVLALSLDSGRVLRSVSTPQSAPETPNGSTLMRLTRPTFMIVIKGWSPARPSRPQ